MLNTVGQSPLGAFIESSLGARTIDVAEGIVLVGAHVTIGASSSVARDIHRFSVSALLPDGVVNPPSLPTYVPTDLGWYDSGSLEFDSGQTTQGNNLLARRGFDIAEHYDAVEDLTSLYACVVTGASQPDGFAVYDLTADPSPSLLFSVALGADWDVGPVLAGGYVIWGEKDEVAKKLTLKRKILPAGTEDSIDIHTWTGVDANWHGLTANSTRDGLIWEFIDGLGEGAESKLEAATVAGAVSATNSKIAGVGEGVADVLRGPDGLRVSNDGFLYAYDEVGQSLTAFNATSLSEDTTKDFDLSGAGYTIPSYGASMITVVNDLCYFRYDGVSSGNYINVVDRAGDLVASMRDTPSESSAIEWQSTDAASFGSVKRPVPIWAPQPDADVETETTQNPGPEPESNLYEVTVGVSAHGNIGADDLPVDSLTTNPTGATLTGGDVSWLFDVTGVPVWPSKADDAIGTSDAYVQPVPGFVSTSDQDGDQHAFELTGTNLQGTTTETWTITIVTTPTVTLHAAPAGAVLFGGTIFWSPPGVGTYPFTLRATTAQGTSDLTWNVVVS